jgi:hypothetical protein
MIPGTSIPLTAGAAATPPSLPRSLSTLPQALQGFSLPPAPRAYDAASGNLAPPPYQAYDAASGNLAPPPGPYQAPSYSNGANVYSGFSVAPSGVQPSLPNNAPWTSPSAAPAPSSMGIIRPVQTTTPVASTLAAQPPRPTLRPGDPGTHPGMFGPGGTFGPGGQMQVQDPFGGFTSFNPGQYDEHAAQNQFGGGNYGFFSGVSSAGY